METDYWKRTEVQPDVDRWLNFYEGCVHCSCDHGCNQWVFEQRARAALLMRAMRQGTKKATLDRLVQIPLERANKIWYWLAMRETIILNIAMREDEKNKIKWNDKDGASAKAREYLTRNRIK